MAKRREKIKLKNGCYISKPQVHPVNWDSSGASVKKEWYIHYRFWDPTQKQYPHGLCRMVRGMNQFFTLEERRDNTRLIIKLEIELLKDKGYNPITRKYSAQTSELSPYTPLIKGLWLAVEKVNAVPAYRTDLKSIVKGIEVSAKALDLEYIPVSQITRRSIYKILDKCADLNKRWSARRHNAYRTALILFFKYFIRMEAAEFNPAREIDKRPEIRKERLTLTDEERTLIDKTLFVNYYEFWRVIQIFFHSGSREVELLGVKGKHVDLVNQSCLYTVKKGKDIREVRRPIKDIALPLWKELMKDCSKEDYLISEGLLPGPGIDGKPIRAEQLTRRWRRHVKKKIFIKREGVKNYINADLYSLRHTQTTEVMDILNDENEASKLTGHKSDKMIAKVYDIRNKQRKDDKVKKVWNKF